MESFTDEQLIGQYLAGDERSFVVLIERYAQPVYNFVSRYVGAGGNAGTKLPISFN